MGSRGYENWKIWVYIRHYTLEFWAWDSIGEWLYHLLNVWFHSVLLLFIFFSSPPSYQDLLPPLNFLEKSNKNWIYNKKLGLPSKIIEIDFFLAFLGITSMNEPSLSSMWLQLAIKTAVKGDTSEERDNLLTSFFFFLNLLTSAANIDTYVAELIWLFNLVQHILFKLFTINIWLR